MNLKKINGNIYKAKPVIMYYTNKKYGKTFSCIKEAEEKNPMNLNKISLKDRFLLLFVKPQYSGDMDDKVATIIKYKYMRGKIYIIKQYSWER